MPCSGGPPTARPRWAESGLLGGPACRVLVYALLCAQLVGALPSPNLKVPAPPLVQTDAKFVRFKAEVIAREARTLAHAVAETAVLRAQLAEAQAASQALAEVRGVVEVDKNGSFSIKAGPTKDPFNLKVLPYGVAWVPHLSSAASGNPVSVPC